MPTISKDLKERLSKIDQIRQELSKAEQSAVKDIMDMLKELMVNNPKLEAIRWQQWIPGFNDGEPCEFTVGEISFQFANAVEKDENGEEQDSEDFMDEYDLKKYFERQVDILNHKEVTALKKSVDEATAVFGKLTEMESQLRDMFGDNMEITVTASGVETEEYDCGY